MVRYARHCVCYVESFQMSGSIMGLACVRMVMGLACVRVVMGLAHVRWHKLTIIIPTFLIQLISRTFRDVHLLRGILGRFRRPCGFFFVPTHSVWQQLRFHFSNSLF